MTAKFSVGQKVYTPDGLGVILSFQLVQRQFRGGQSNQVYDTFEKNRISYCVNLIPTLAGYTPSFFEKDLRSAAEPNDILKEII